MHREYIQVIEHVKITTAMKRERRGVGAGICVGGCKVMCIILGNRSDIYNDGQRLDSASCEGGSDDCFHASFTILSDWLQVLERCMLYSF